MTPPDDVSARTLRVEASGWRWAMAERGYWPRRWWCALTEHRWQVGETPDGQEARRCRYCRRGEVVLPTVLTYPNTSTENSGGSTTEEVTVR